MERKHQQGIWAIIWGGALALSACSTAPTQPAVDADAPAASPRVARVNPFKAQNIENSADYHFALAQAYSQDGNPDRAVEEYKLALIYDANSALIHARLATEYIKKGMLSAALESAKASLKSDPKFIDARLLLAGLYSTNQETDRAVQEYDRVLKQDPEHEEAAVYRSIILADAERGKEAVKGLEAFLKRKSDSPLVWYHLGRIEQQLGRVDPAAKAYQKAMTLRPGFIQASLALGFLYEEHQKNADAMKVYKALYDETQDSGAANRLATLYLKEEKYSQAIPYLEAITYDDPEDMNAQVKLGLVQMQLKRFDAAVATFQKILDKYPDSDRVLYYQASVFEETGRELEAVDRLKRVPADSKMFSEAVVRAPYLLKKLGKNDEAKAFVDAELKKHPKISGLYVMKASFAEDDKDLSGAIEVLKEAANRFPEDERILYYLGSLHDRVGETDQGLARMEAILKVNPDNVDALNYIGYTWTTRGVRLDDAEKLLRRAIRLKPGNAFVQDSWGWHLFVRGRTKEAIVELEKAVKLKPDEATILEHLGDAYVKHNLRERAREQYQEAAQFADDADTKRKLEQKIQTLGRELGISERRMPASE